MNADYRQDPVFCAAGAALLRREGGYQNAYRDRGNWTSGAVGRGTLKGTKFGITAMNYPELDIKNLTEAQALAIYFRDRWERFGMGRLLAPLAGKLLDQSAPMGAREATKCLQRAVRACGTRIKDDGALGPITIRASNHVGAASILPPWREACAGYYRLVVESRPTDHPFLAGWLARAYDEE